MLNRRNRYLEKIADIASGPLVEEPPNKLGSVTEKDKYGRTGSMFVYGINGNDNVSNQDAGNEANS